MNAGYDFIYFNKLNYNISENLNHIYGIIV